MKKTMSWIEYKSDIDNFQFCVRKKCPLRKSCLRKVTHPFNSEYYTIGGKFDKATNSCIMHIDKRKQ